MDFDKLFEKYPYIESKELILKKIEHSDIDEFFELISDDLLYRYKPGKAKNNKKTVDNMIDHYERDFNKKKIIYLGIYLKSESMKLIGLGEVFDFDKNVNSLTFGYTLNQNYWGKGYATKYTNLIVDYLINDIKVNRIQAYVMPENTKSHNVLERCGFVKEGIIRQGHVWKDKGVVDLTLYSVLRLDYEK